MEYSVSPFICPSARNIWITYIQAYMPHESSEDSLNQPDVPLDPLGPPVGLPLDPVDTVGPHLDPLGPFWPNP